jgi:hypothetical protein
MDEIKPGDRVRINIKAFDWQKNTLTPKFMEFVNRNADTIFTVKEYKEDSSLYTFVENDTWLFWVGNLTKL